MPAITVNNLLSLDKIQQPIDSAILRPVKNITMAPKGFEGEGFPVRRAFSEFSLTDIDPFIMMDQMGEVEWEVGEAKGTPWHPHRGFETVTYLIDGQFKHKDSNGGGGIIGNGDTQWMTAGSGILHIEAPTEAAVLKGGLFHGVQIWVNLPSSMKLIHPRYQDIHGSNLKLLTTYNTGALIRIIAGDIGGFSGPGNTYTPVSIIHASVHPDSVIEIPWEKSFNALGYILSGSGYVGNETIPILSGQAILFGQGDFIKIGANRIQDSRSNNLEILILGGLPIQEPVAWYGPFVMNNYSELEKAFSDYRSGYLGNIMADKSQ